MENDIEVYEELVWFVILTCDRSAPSNVIDDINLHAINQPLPNKDLACKKKKIYIFIT